VRIPTVLTWRLAYPTLVAILATGWVSAPAWALTLGRISAESSIGQPLVAQLDVVQITDEQAGSLEVSLADPDRFAAANMQLNPALIGLRATLVNSETSGRASIRLETSEPISEPFLDIALQFRWAGGQLLRTYTLLLDPPNLQPTPQPAPLTPDVGTPIPVLTLPLPIEEPAPPAPAFEPPPAEEPPPERTTISPAPRAPAQVTVRSGDTATRIMQSHLQPGLTMDQLLLALLRNNPNAFINDNVNLVRAGTTLVIPTAEQAQTQSAAQARLEVRAQTREFIAYRQRLAQAAPATSTEQPAQRIAGRVEEQVEVVTPPATVQDRLELTKGQDTQSEASEQIAQSRQEQEAQQRLNELERNLEELQALADQAIEPEEATPPAFGPGLPLVDDKEELLTLPNALTEPVIDEQAKSPADQARNAVERVIQHPATVPAALALIALLALLGIMRARRLRQSQSFKKTADRAATHVAASVPAASSTPAPVPPSEPSPEEDSVDPLSEAEVYLAYGMDDQAEAMLRHALAQDPASMAARVRLLEVYKMRGDVLPFNTLAQEMYEMTLGQTAEWEATASMGRELDPSNPLYHPMLAADAQGSLDLPDDVKGLSLDLDPFNDGNKRQP